MLTTALLDACNDILDATIASFSDAGIALPSRQYLHVGDPADDDTGTPCAGLLVVYASAIARNPLSLGPGVQVAPQPVVTTATIGIRLTRCVPSFAPGGGGRSPTASDITDAHTDILKDGVVLWSGLLTRHLAGTLTSACSIATFGPLRAITPSGSRGGWVHALGVEI